MTVHLYDAVSAVDWRGVDPFVRAYTAVLMRNPLQELITNVRTVVRILQAGHIVLPVTITTYHDDNSYVCSPFNQYFKYGLEELDLLENAFLVRMIRAGLSPMLAFYRASEFDRAVMVNNWLLSTNLWQPLPAGTAGAIIDELKRTYPDRAIIFRSVDEHTNPDLFQALENAGCMMVFSRQVYYQDGQVALRKRDFKRDLRLYRTSAYERIADDDLTEPDFDRLAELYHQLYIDRYSRQNPQYMSQFMIEMWRSGCMSFRALRRDDRIDAFRAQYVRNGVMTNPLFGYDTTIPIELGLYRMLSADVALEGIERGYVIHNSAGVGAFKRQRGAHPVVEYNAVCVDHLPIKQQALWMFLNRIMKAVVLPIIQRSGF